MSRVKRGVTTHARHKKILDMAKGYRGRSKMFLELRLKKLKKLYNMHTVTDAPKREVSALCGFRESMRLPVCRI